MRRCALRLAGGRGEGVRRSCRGGRPKTPDAAYTKRGSAHHDSYPWIILAGAGASADTSHLLPAIQPAVQAGRVCRPARSVPSPEPALASPGVHKRQDAAPRQSKRLGSHVRGDVDGLWQLGDGHLEARLDILQDLGVLVGRCKGDGEPLGAKAPGAADAVQLTTILTRSMSMPRPQMSVETRMRCLKSLKFWYSLMRSSCFIDPWMATEGKLHSCKGVPGRGGGGGGLSSSVREAGVDEAGVPPGASECRMSMVLGLPASARERLRCQREGVRPRAHLQELVERVGPLDRLDEDDHLVELEGVEKLVELPVLLVFSQLDIVLLQAVQGQL
eukprot:scaffold8791_cov98-Isochrysis_galbana.AAC.6